MDIHGYELQRKTRIKETLPDGSSIPKTKWVETKKKLHGHRIGSVPDTFPDSTGKHRSLDCILILPQGRKQVRDTIKNATP